MRFRAFAPKPELGRVTGYQRSVDWEAGRSKIHGRVVGATSGGGTKRTLALLRSRSMRPSAGRVATKSDVTVAPEEGRKRRLILAGRRAARVFTADGR